MFRCSSGGRRRRCRWQIRVILDFMTIAITGATGFVGRVVVPLLLAQGHCVRALVRGGGPALPVQTIVGDLLQPESLAELMRGADGVIHLAAGITRSTSL